MSLVERIDHADVEGIRVGRFHSQVNTTVFLYRLGDTIIDTGPPNQWRLIAQFLHEKPIRRALLSHHHEDHAGNAFNIKTKLNVPVFGHPRTVEYLANGFFIHLYRRVVWGYPRRTRIESLPANIGINRGLTILPIYSPGHSDDLTCYLEPEHGWLFTGDLFITRQPRYLRRDEDPNLEIHSIKEVLKHNFEVIFCAHRGVVMGGHQALMDKLEYMESLRAQVRELSMQGKPAREITQRLLGDEDLFQRITSGHFSKINLVKAFIT